MKNARVIGAQLDGTHIFRGGNRNRNRKVSEDVFSSGRQREVVRRGHHQIWLPELPALRQRGQRRTCGRIALGRTALDPLSNQLDLRVGQTALVIEVTVT